jgi:hypothetical protein
MVAKDLQNNIHMKNLEKIWDTRKMFAIISAIIFLCSCQKDQSSIDEYRYRRGINWRRPTSPVDSTSSPGTTTDSTLNHQNSTDSSAVTLPKVSAGYNLSVTVTSISLDGSQSTGGASYLWTKEIGPSATIASAASLKTNVTGLVTGEYRFPLTAKNSAGTASDTVHVSVTLPPSTNGTSNNYQRQNLIKETTFEETDPFSQWHNTQHCCSYSITKSNSVPARAGNYSMQVELYKTDATVAASKRAEINESTSEPINAERWVGASYYFPSATYAQDKDAELIMQWHTDAPTGSPPLALWTMNGKIDVQQAIDPSGGATTNPAYFSHVTLQNIIYDKWIDIVVHYKQRSDATGLVEIWINGVKVYTKSGPNTFSAYANYFKIGINKWTWMPGASYGGTQTHRLFYIDELRFGNEKATYKDVVPGNN